MKNEHSFTYRFGCKNPRNKKPIMIFGYLQKSGLGNGKVIDYVGVPYPEGNIGPQAQIGFQRYDITEVVFTGYETRNLSHGNSL